MSKVVELNLNPEPKILRQFGYIALAGFGLLAAFAWYERALFAFGLGDARQPLTLTFIALGGVSFLFSLVYPRGNRPLFVLLSVVTFPIGFVLSYLIMGVLFFFIFGIAAILLRIFGRDLMNRALDAKLKSYWSTRQGQRPRDSYFSQY